MYLIIFKIIGKQKKITKIAKTASITSNGARHLVSHCDGRVKFEFNDKSSHTNTVLNEK